MFKRLMSYWFRHSGWIFTGTLPKRLNKSVIVAAPHTRTRDLMVAFGVISLTHFSTGILVDERRMKGLSGLLLRMCKAVPLPADREAAKAQLLDAYAAHRTCSFIFTPYRNGKRTELWDDLFYEIASETGMPIVPVGLDHHNRRVKFHAYFYPSIDPKRDLGFLKRYFQSFDR